jgi:KDO2-lipid IV(A) lauroyltransferase
LISEEDLIKSYFAKLERDIKELPEYWLWSHKRWKHKRIKSDTTNP